MDTTNRPESNLPARISSSGARVPASIPPAFGMASGTPSAQAGAVSPRTLLRGLMRHWWHILGLSILFSLPILYAIWLFVPPKYEASGLIQVEPSKPSLYSTGADSGDRSFAEKYLRSQIDLIRSQDVLSAVVANPLVEKFPLIAKSDDPRVDLVDALSVDPIPSTFLIRVALQSKDADEAHQIVQAVINSYMDYVRENARKTNKALENSYKTQKESLDVAIKNETRALTALAEKGNIHLVTKSAKGPADGGATPEEQAPGSGFSADDVTEADYARFKSEYIKTQMQLETAEAILKKKEAESDPTKQAAAREEEQLLAETELHDQIETEFFKDPEVEKLVAEMDARKEELARVNKMARRWDPAAGHLRDKIMAMEERYRNLWEAKYDEIKKRVQAQNPAVGGSAETLAQIRQRVEDLQLQKESLERHLNTLKIENKDARVDAIQAELIKRRLDGLHRKLEQVNGRMEQAAYDSEHEHIRISIADAAKKPHTPSQNKRIKLMAVVPVAMLCAFLGLFLLLEIKAERISDPESLSTRVQSEVFSLPPLPSAKEVRKMRQLENGSDQIDRFIQRLDHLRFAVCGSQTPLSNGRCVLITSAVGGEGKTTLAAQLAARCGNAGMSTLLIDADLRRASLGTLLDIPEGPGLSDVLKGEITVEEAAVPVQGGAFHLLLAGSPVEDVSRILNGEKIGSLVARLRELYDLIVIDSPPVLPVPDALILGHWADGAILASRFDISRFPQVERARRQLDIAGITVLGTVINGMRSSDSYYGHYSYNRKKGAQPNSSNAS